MNKSFVSLSERREGKEEKQEVSKEKLDGRNKFKYIKM